MEDKELQELFDAKRTVEANRRRQEELRRMMAASAAPKSRRLWPVWALSAAASLALLLITLPILFRGETAEPRLVAKSEMPVSVEQSHFSSSPKLGEGDHTKCGGGVCQKPLKHTPPSALRAAIPSLPGSVGDMACDQSGANLEGELAVATEEPVLIAESEPMVAEEPEEPLFAEDPLPTTDTPTIHRRTSTRLANSSNIVNVPSVRSDFHELLADVFASEPSTPLTLKTIDL